MTYRYFRALHKNQQIELVLNDGTFLMDAETNGLTIYLYQIECFYAELCFSRESGRIKWVSCFEDTGKLTPYLEKIDLPDLTDCWL